MFSFISWIPRIKAVLFVGLALALSLSASADDAHLRPDPCWSADTLQLNGSAAKDVEDWEDDDEGLTGGDSCPGAATKAGEILLAVDQPTILAIDAGESDLSAFLAPIIDGGSTSEGTLYGPARTFVTRIAPGAYSLRWTVPDGEEDFCGPRISFYPVSTDPS